MEGAERGDALRASLGIPPERFTVGWVGRMTAVKQAQRRPADGAAAARPRRRRGARDGRRRPRPRRSSRRSRASSGSTEATRFVGFQDDVGPWFHAFDALLLPSRSEGTPVSAIETLASGRPVVATRVGGVADVVHDGVDGYLFPFGDVDAAAEHLATLAADPALRARMGAAGRERALGATACRGSSTTSTASTGRCSPRRGSRSQPERQIDR